MDQHLSPESIQLIANLINDKNDALNKTLEERHISLEGKIRMIKTTVQDNHAVSIEARDLGRKTNGRVSKLEDDIYGEVDKHGIVHVGNEGVLYDLELLTKWKWLYRYWQVPIAITLGFTALYIKESRDFIVTIIDKII